MKRQCTKHGLTDYVKDVNGTARCKKCRSDAVTEARRKRKRQFVELLGGKCERCGYARCIDALHFHHRDPKQKSFAVSNKGACKAFKTVLAEVQKCQLLCANCHAEVECTKLPHG